MVFNRDESNNQMDPSDHHHPMMMIVSGVHHSVTHSLTVVVLVRYNVMIAVWLWR